MSHYCMYCAEYLGKYNLDFTRDIVCGTCVQKLIGGKELPCFHPQKLRKVKKIRGIIRDE